MSEGNIENVVIQRKLFFKIARDPTEYVKDIVPSDEFIQKLRQRGVDIFTFLERKWRHTVKEPQKQWIKAEDNIGILHLNSYEEWLKRIGKKTRNMIRKAEKSGIRTQVAQPDDTLAEGLWRIYNETPIRQGRAFPHYGISLETVKKNLEPTTNSTYILAYLQNELVGFIQLLHGVNITIISQILSQQKHWDKAVNNALVAKAVEVCGSMKTYWIMYGRMGNHPTLDNFKQNNGFTKLDLTRYFIPLTTRGRLAAKLGLHIEIKDRLPQAVKQPLFPFYSWVSRTKMRIKLLLKPIQIT